MQPLRLYVLQPATVQLVTFPIHSLVSTKEDLEDKCFGFDATTVQDFLYAVSMEKAIAAVVL